MPRVTTINNFVALTVQPFGAEVSEAKLKELEGKGLPARAVYNMMRALAEKHSKTSKNFWK